MTRPGCVVLDVDDTLYLERDYAASGFRAVGRWIEQTYGVAGFERVAQGLFDSGVRRTIFDSALAELGIAVSDDLVATLVDVYRRHRPSIAMLPDAVALIESLRAGGVPLAVITDGPAASQHTKVDALGLRAVARPVIVTEDLGAGYGKPHRRAFEEVERAYAGSLAGRCVYVADNPLKDFVAPHDMSWETVRVRRPGALHEAVPSGPDVDVEVSDLYALCARWSLSCVPS